MGVGGREKRNAWSLFRRWPSGHPWPGGRQEVHSSSVTPVTPVLRTGLPSIVLGQPDPRSWVVVGRRPGHPWLFQPSQLPP